MKQKKKKGKGHMLNSNHMPNGIKGGGGLTSNGSPCDYNKRAGSPESMPKGQS